VPDADREHYAKWKAACDAALRAIRPEPAYFAAFTITTSRRAPSPDQTSEAAE
jgi:hypothetical protein